MSLFGRLINKRRITATTDLARPDAWLSKMLGGSIRTKTGVSVNEENALKYSAVFACVRVISEGVATLPFPIYQKLERGKEKARNHPLYDMLQIKPNPEMTAFSFRETMQMHLLLWGNAYAEIEFSKAGKPLNLWLLTPNRTKRVRDDQGRTRYRVTLPNGSEKLLYKEQVLHISGPSLNGIDGLSPIGYNREAIGLGMATEEFGSRFFLNGTNMGAVVEHPGTLSDSAEKHLKGSLQEKYEGLGNAHRLLLLEEGMKLHKIGIPPNDAQFLETRKFQTREIARFYNVRPHMIGDLENATFSNIEHQGIEHVVHTLTPWLRRWEQEVNTKVVTDKGFFAEFVVDALLRGDIKSRYEAYAIGKQWGFLNTDMIMENENMNPLPDNLGQMFYVPMNMVPAEQAQAKSESDQFQERSDRSRPVQNRKRHSPVQMRSAQLKNRTADSFKPMFRDAEKRIVGKEVKEIKRALKKHLNERSESSFRSWLESYYREFPGYIREQMEPVIHTLAAQIQSVVEEELGQEIESTSELSTFVRNYVDAFTARYIGSSQAQLKALMRDSEAELTGEIADELEERLDEWEEKRPDKIAMRETVQASNALAKTFYIFAGVASLRWVTMGSKTCSLCEELDGEVVGIEKYFIERDESLEGEDGNEITVQKPCGHAPLHDGCQCQIVAD